MPLYDQRCLSCGAIAEYYCQRESVPACKTCGEATERIWTQTAPVMIQDSIEGGLVVENLSAKPQTFYSKSEMRRAMDAAGVQHKVEHKGLQGSDKSPHTTRWI